MPHSRFTGALASLRSPTSVALRRALILAGSLLCACGLLPGAASAAPAPSTPAAIDGPSPDIVSLAGLTVARDGSGGLAYLKQVAGMPHVFVSRLLGGVFQPPEQVDASLPGPSSHPVIAASSGGALAVAFISSGILYAVTRAAATGSYAAPEDLFHGASSPAIGMTLLGKAYLAFTATGTGGHDIRAAYFSHGAWGLEPTPLDAQPADDAGTGSGRPSVAAASDGVAIVAWGEAGHVYTRRVWATSPSILVERADVASLGGWQEVSADQPSVSAGGNSSYADVVYHELLASGSAQQSRVLMGHLRASQYDPVAQPDGLTTPGAGGADQPQVALGEYSRGFVTSARTDTNQVIAAHAGTVGLLDSVFRTDSLQNATLPYAVPGLAGLTSTLIAWQHDPGPLGMTEIRARYAPDGSTPGPELVLSSPAAGPTDARDGLSASGDTAGDAAVAWVQGAPGSRQIMVGQMYQPPGTIAPTNGFAYLRSSHPTLAWTPVKALWGPIRYLVSVDGIGVAQTAGTSLQVPAPLRDGGHTWQVTAVNPAGLGSTMRPVSFWIDTVAPTVSLSVTGGLRAGASLHAFVGYSDPPPEPSGTSSGIADVLIRWGDGSSYHIVHDKFHAYRRAGRYTVTVTVTDRAGNASTASRLIRIATPSNRSRQRLRTGQGSPQPHQRPGGKR